MQKPADNQKPSQKPAQKPGKEPQTDPPKLGDTVTWTIPLNVSVTLGQAGISNVSSGKPMRAVDGTTPGAESVEAAAEEARRLLEGRACVVNVRAGYRFENGWITDERVVVVAVTGEIEEIPEQVSGVPVQVTPASPWDLLQSALQEEGLERVPATHYRPPSDVELEQGDEEMQLARPGEEAADGMVKMSLWDLLYGDG